MKLNYDRAIETFAQYGKTPRQVQIDFLHKIIPLWDTQRVHVVQAPVATGKSLLLRAIQAQTNAAIITSENVLVDQYGATFDDVNILKGKARYKCCLGETCEMTYKSIGKLCEKCPYSQAKEKAALEVHTIYNPMSYLLAVQNGLIQPADVLLIDEAHKLGGFLRQIGTVELKQSDVHFKESDVENPDKIITYLRKAIFKLENLIKMKQDSKLAEGLKDDIDLHKKMGQALKAVIAKHSDYFFHISQRWIKGKMEKTLVVEPLYPPKYFIDTFLKSQKILLTSGTMFPHHVTDLFGPVRYSYTELPATIPVERRRIINTPAAPTMNKDTAPEVYATKIKEIIARHKGQRGIIHATYGLAEKLAPLMPANVITHNKESKSHSLDMFKEAGPDTWLLASGMSEGVDLAGDLARINIITKLQYPNLGDAYVNKRKSLIDGNLWYAATTLEHLMQASGRTTRGVEDSSIIYVLDPGLARLVESIRKMTKHDPTLLQAYLPKSFFDSIAFT